MKRPKLFNIVLTIIFLILLLIFKNIYKSRIEKLQTTVSLFNVEKQEFTKTKNALQEEIVKVKAVVVKDKEQLKEYTDKIFKLKDEVKTASVFYQEVLKTKWDTAYIPYHDTLVVYKVLIGDTITAEIKNYVSNSIKVPNSFSKDTSTYYLSGRVLKEGVSIDSLNIPDTFNLRVVETKGKLFKPSYIEFQTKHSNPLINVIGVKAITYKLPKKTFFQWISEKALWIGVGFGLSTIIK